MIPKFIKPIQCHGDYRFFVLFVHHTDISPFTRQTKFYTSLSCNLLQMTNWAWVKVNLCNGKQLFTL